ncbi:hypothetical protein Q0590_05120 [Rhodocytophaga aerolata]|uniref:Lipoprotein n=1 Tax=Rhodocytophaga aerolata TaxID=455078 RepID=A0ABT8R4E4_9BACT|nr:hypothetical protein [Rhodocytophaga aerolata]MDO1445617.1 hypothetical protein [Rhodocytophaga aerolata]
MKTHVFVLLVTGSFLASSCSSGNKPESTTGIVPAAMATQPATAEAIDQEPELSPEDEFAVYPPVPVQKLETIELSQENTTQFLQKHNLSTVWLGAIQSEDASASVFNGFYGEDRYRIEMYLASVEKDARQPNLYRITGKSRFKDNIVPFSGQITIESIGQVQDTSLTRENLENWGFKEIFVAKGKFTLKEDASFKGSGVFAGEVFIDLGIRNFEESYEANEIDTWTAFYKEIDEDSGIQLTGLSRGSGFLLDGNWTSYETNKVKPVLVAKDIFLISNNILENFMIGERDVVINPKYRQLGWDTYWSNDEWWNDAKPIL